MPTIEFHEELNGARAAIGVAACCMYGFGGTVLALSVSPVFEIIHPLTWLIAFALCGKSALTGLAKQRPMKILLLTLCTFLLWFALQTILFGSILEPAILKAFGYESLASSNTSSFLAAVRASGKVAAAALLFGGAVLGPIVEQFLYRICFFTTMRRKGRLASHLLTALLFGAQHVFVAMFYEGRPEEVLLIGGYMASSLVLTTVYEKTKTPVPGIFAHIAFNALGLCYMLSNT